MSETGDALRNFKPTPPAPWVEREASEVQVGDILIRNVRPGFEWAAIDCGAFVVRSVSNAGTGDEWRIRGVDASGVDKKVRTFAYDVSEIVMVKPNLQ